MLYTFRWEYWALKSPPVPVVSLCMTAPDKSDDFITVSFSLVRSNNQPANVRVSPSVADRARHDSVNNIFCGYIYFHPASQSGYGPVAVAGVINGAVNAVKSKGFGSVPRFCCLRACISPPDAEHPFKPCVGYDDVVGPATEYSPGSAFLTQARKSLLVSKRITSSGRKAHPKPNAPGIARRPFVRS